jgi:hypothetical protein
VRAAAERHDRVTVLEAAHAPRHLAVAMETHTQFVDKVVELLRSDARIDGVAVGGSWVARQMDRYSDLDFVVGVSAEHHAAVMAERSALAARLGPLLAAFPGDFLGEPRLLICLYGPPLLHVDFKFVATPDLARRIEDPEVLWERDEALTRAMAVAPARWPTPDLQWSEDRFWTWVHYAATKLARGELFEVIDFLAFLRRVVLGPLAAVADGGRPNGARRLERTALTSVDALRQTVAAYDAASCQEALAAAIGLYRALRDRLASPELVRRDRAEALATRFLDEGAQA